jgi:hypoxanthine phosphoribosyltransferase
MPLRLLQRLSPRAGRRAITDQIDTLLTPEDVQARVDALADKLAPRLSQGSWTAVVILLGATPFAADLLRAFSRRGLDIGFDALWLESYHDERVTSGRVVVRADVSRPVEGRGILLIDDVFDTGRTIAFARTHLMTQGAREVVAAVFARKPDAVSEGLDAWAWDAPPRYLVGYGMDDAGKMRGLPFIGAIKGS